MHLFRHAVQLLGLLLCTIVVHAQQPPTDSLQQVLAHTVDPARQVRLLLDLKDLNEDTPLNLSYSIRLFQKAVLTGAPTPCLTPWYRSLPTTPSIPKRPIRSNTASASCAN